MKKAKMLDVVLLLYCIVTVPVGIGQYYFWAAGAKYSLVFMFLGLLFPILMFARILKTKRRKQWVSK